MTSKKTKTTPAEDFNEADDANVRESKSKDASSVRKRGRPKKGDKINPIFEPENSRRRKHINLDDNEGPKRKVHRKNKNAEVAAPETVRFSEDLKENNNRNTAERKTHAQIELEKQLKRQLDVQTNSFVDFVSVHYNKGTEDDESDNEILNNHTKKNKKPEIQTRWSTEDLIELVDRVEKCIPLDDNLSYKCRLTKLEWDKVLFKNYTVEECQKEWSQLEKKVRHYRLLREVVKDVKHVITVPGEKLPGRVAKLKRHPDMPKRPLSSYFLYYIKKKDKVLSEHPDCDMIEVNRLVSEMYKNLSPEKKEKYEKLAAQNMEEYKQKVDTFYETHPEVPRHGKGQKARKKKETIQKQPKIKPPKRPDNPYKLFFLSESERGKCEDADKSEFKDACREKWKHLPDKKKLVWINYAEGEFTKYQEALKEYVATNPGHVHNPPTKPFLSKEELTIKERLAGKPRKPPGTAYSLFASEILQTPEIKNVPVRERLNYVSIKWKEMSESEKRQYKTLLEKVTEKYNRDFMIYLASLPEEKRQAEILQSMSKKKRLETEIGKKLPTTSKKDLIKIEEPEQPPRTAFKYFTLQYKGQKPAKQEWKALSPEEKQKYEQKLIEEKQAYIVEFEKFLKSLSKEELEAFSNSRKQAAKESEEEDDAESSDENDAGSSSEDSEASEESDE